MTERRAAGALSLGAVNVIVGSLGTWAGCTDESCDGRGQPLPFSADRSGMDFGPGLETLVLGVVLLVIGIVTYRHRETPRTWAVALVAALTTLALTAWWVFGMYVLSDFRLAGPKLGAYQVALGAVIAAIASVRLRKIGQMDRWSN